METAIRDTSIETYRSEVLPTLGKRQAQVLDVLKYKDNWTNTELAQALGWPINTITPRVNELRKLGLVVEDGKRQCRVTGRTAYAWRITSQTLF